jgi:flagellar basal-body rod modification protein FlgD
MYVNELLPTNNQSVNAGVETSRETELGRDAFLRLLVAQLEHQDPLNPMESSEFTAQLAQFSSLEQLFNINENLEVIKGTESEQGTENLLDYIGKEVKSDQNNITVYDGNSTKGSYSLAEPGHVIISIFNSAGTEIRTIYKQDQASGEYDFYFDGKDNNGYQVSDGEYTFTVQAFDNEGLPIVVDSGLSGEVTAVTYQGDTPYLVVGDQLLNPLYVTEVSLGETP